MEESAHRQDALISHEARDLQRKRDKGHAIHDAQQAEEQPAREDVRRGSGTGGQTLGDVSRCALAAKTVNNDAENTPLSRAELCPAFRCSTCPTQRLSASDTPVTYVTPVLAGG